uniref:MICOS complex subunit MIC60 n=1 Tax=Romanomermis culicivorax TaxID=13658 RepID=A0A915I7H9_ROMCU
MDSIDNESTTVIGPELKKRELNKLGDMSPCHPRGSLYFSSIFGYEFLLNNDMKIKLRISISRVTSIGRKIFLYSVSTAAVGLGATYTYAYFDKDFRKSVERSFPPVKLIFDALLHEEKSNVIIEKNIQKQNKNNANDASLPAPIFLPQTVPDEAQKSNNEHRKEDIIKLVEEILDKKLVQLTSSQKTDMTEKNDSVSACYIFHVEIAKAQFQTELQQEIARINEMHAKHEEEMLRSQRENLDLQHKKDIQNTLTQERQQYAQNLSSAIAQLSSLEIFLNGREQFDSLNRRAKKLWVSCQNLKRLLDGSEAETKRPLAHIVSDIKIAGTSDEFVQETLKTIPDQIMNCGTYTEEELYERFQKVKRLCRRFGRIENDKAGLVQYILSYLQSLVIFDSEKMTSIKSEIDPHRISVYEILSRTSFCLKKRDHETAVRLMSLLKGESAKIASDWLKDLRNYAELKQMADVLVAHASAQSIRSLY